MESGWIIASPQARLGSAGVRIAIKLIGRREHHQDLTDVKELMNHSDFDWNLFWEMVDLLQARSLVTELLKTL